MRVNSAAFALNTNYQRNRTNLEASMERLSSGDRLVRTGVEPGSSLSQSERFRLQIRNAEASSQSLQFAMSYLNTTDAFSQTVSDILQRMMELAGSSAQEINTAADRQALDLEFQALKDEVSNLTRDTGYEQKQTIGTDVLVTYDATTDYIKFWQPTGLGGREIERDFSANGWDADGTLIGFDNTEDFSMSRDGRSLYYLGAVAGDPGGTVRVKKYDIESHSVTIGADLFATTDKMFVDEDGALYVNGAGTIYTVDTGDMSRTATAIVDATVGSEFSAYKGQVTYYRNDNNFVSADPGTGTPTVLSGPTVFGAGDHTFSGSGNFVAEENPAGTINVIHTSTGNSATVAIGTANAVHDLHFNDDGDRIFFINKDTNSINSVSVRLDSNNNVILADNGKVIQGTNPNSFNGLDAGGANYSSNMSLIIAQDSIHELDYGAIDLDLYSLGLVNTGIDTLGNANTAITEVQEASNRLNAARTKLRAKSVRFEFILDGHRAFTANVATAESQIRDVDVAREAIVYSSFQVKSQAAAAVLAQFNTLSQNVLALLQ